MSILQFSEHIKLIFDNSNVNNTHGKQIKQKMANFFSANFAELSNFSSLSFWEQTLWNPKLLPITTTARCSCYTLVGSFRTSSCFPFFLQTFLKLIFATKIKRMLLEQSAVLFISCEKNILRISCVGTLKILYINKRILT